jgi:hypothetical protein
VTRRAAALAAGALALLCSCTREPQSPVATEPPAPPGAAAGAALFAGAPPAKMVVDGRPLDVDPGGAARYLVRVRFVDAAGRPTDLVSGGDVSFTPSRGSAQWQTRLRFGGPAAIVSTYEDGPLAVDVRADVGVPVPGVRVATDTRTWRVPRTVARALGPHSVWLGWFPRVTRGAVSIVRSGGSAPARTIATVVAPSSGYRDESVTPGTRYRYDVKLPTPARGVVLAAPVPAAPRYEPVAAVGGKAVWLSFSPSRLDDDGYDKLDPGKTLARATASGLRSIDIRTTYGPFREITADDEPAIDAIVDGATARGIAPVAWTVPRSTSFEDLEAEVAAAAYRTPSGHGFAALAVDLERGEYFLGSGSAGYAALGAYLRDLRAALGPRYPIVATVEDPFLEHLTASDYPYAAIAAQADVLQPMVYWRMMSRGAVTPRTVRAALAGSYAAVSRAAGRSLPIDLGLQSAAEGARGAPAPAEIAAAVAQARALGAIGVTFFDWNGTPERGWRAIAAAKW